MGQRFVPITVAVEGVGKGTAEVKTLTNAFDQLDNTGKKAATGGLKNAFDSSHSLNNELKSLGGTSDFVKNQLSLLQNDVAKLVPNLEAAEAGVAGLGSGGAAAGAGLASMLNPITALVIAIPLIVGLFASAAFGAVELSKHAAETGDKIYQVQQQSKLLPETLSAISVGAELTGSSLQGLSGGLITFDKNLTAARESDTKFAKQLRASSVDISTNEAALRGIFRALSLMPVGQQQATLAEAAFGASSREVLEVVKETNGNLDVAIQKYGDLGLILSGHATEAAHQFQKELTTVNLQIDSVKVRVGQQFMPLVLGLLQQLSAYLDQNSGQWVRWAGDVVEAIKDVKATVDDLATLGATVTGLGPLINDFSDLLSVLRQIGGAVSGIDAVIKLIRDYGAARRPVDPNAIPAQATPDLGTPLRPSTAGVLTEAQQDLLNKTKQRYESLQQSIASFGETTHVAATRQAQLKDDLADVTTELGQQQRVYRAGELALAARLDQMEAAKKANDEAIKQAKKQADVQQAFRNETDAVILRTRQLGDAEGAARTELEKFNEALIKRTDRDLLDPADIERRIAAVKDLDLALAHIAQTKAFDKLDQQRKDVVNALQSVRENVGQTALQTIPDDQQRLEQRHAVLTQTARSIERISGLKIDRTQFAGLVELFKEAPAAIDMGHALELLRKQLDPKVLENISPKDIASIVAILKEAAVADQALADAQTPLAIATAQLKQELKDLQNEVPIAAETAALRYQIAWQDANNAVALASDAAIRRQIQNQVYLAHQLDVDFARLDDGVVDFLAHQKTLQETFQDVRTNTVRAFFDGIDSAIDKMTKHLGVAGSVLGQFLKDLAHLAASQLLQRLLGIGSQGQAAGGNFFGGGGSQVSGGGGGIFGGLLNRVFNPSGGGGSPLTGGFAGGSGGAQYFASPFGLIPAGLAGGLTPPASLTSQLTNSGILAGAAQENLAHQAELAGGLGGAGAGGFSLAGLGAGVAPLLPLLGLTAGAGLGGQSRLGSILGGAGGLIGGLGLAAALSPGFALGLGGALTSIGLPGLGGFFSATSGLALLGPIAAIAAPLIIGAIILGKNKARQAAERQRNTISNDTGTAIWQLIDQAKSIGLSAATSQWNQIKSNYATQVAQIKDSKTRRNAELQWTNDFAPLWKIVEARAKEGEKAKEIAGRIVPEFSTGADFKANGFARSDFYVPKAARGLLSIPGIFDHKDDVLMRVSRGEHVAVMTPQQYGAIGGRDAFEAAGVPALGTGGLFASSRTATPSYTPPSLNFGPRPEATGTASLGRVKSENSEPETLTLNLRIKGVNSDQVTFEGLQSSRNRRLVVSINDQASIDRD